MFTKQLIQTISDWQRGGDLKQKARRGAALKAAAQQLPQKFRQPPAICYRQIALDGHSLMLMGTHYRLSETISSWTKSEAVAKKIKRGVPPPGDYQGVIFKIAPAPQSVILDLTALFSDPAFAAAVEQHKNHITGHGDGIGRYGNSQQEVVLEIDDLRLEDLMSWGGYTDVEQRLAEMYFEQKPSDVQMKEFRELMVKAN
jgi:hypothetical protein